MKTNILDLQHQLLPGTMAVEDLPAGTPEKTLSGKPYFAIAVMAAVAVLFLVFPVGNSWVLGVILGALVIFTFIKARSYVQFAFYPEYLVIYDAYDPKTCQKLEWSDIKEWGIDTRKGTTQILKIHLYSTPMVSTTPLLGAGGVYRAFQKRLPHKESAYLQRQEINRRIDENHSSFSLFNFSFLNRRKKH